MFRMWLMVQCRRTPGECRENTHLTDVCSGLPTFTWKMILPLMREGRFVEYLHLVIKHISCLKSRYCRICPTDFVSSSLNYSKIESNMARWITRTRWTSENYRTAYSCNPVYECHHPYFWPLSAIKLEGAISLSIRWSRNGGPCLADGKQ